MVRIVVTTTLFVGLRPAPLRSLTCMLLLAPALADAAECDLQRPALASLVTADASVAAYEATAPEEIFVKMLPGGPLDVPALAARVLGRQGVLIRGHQIPLPDVAFRRLTRQKIAATRIVTEGGNCSAGS